MKRPTTRLNQHEKEIIGNRSHPGASNLGKLAFSQGPIAATKGACRCKSPKSR